MWFRRKWMLVAVLAAVVVLVGGIIGGMVYAQTDTPTPTVTATNPGDTLLGKVAEKLGIDQQTLKNAFTEAQKELQSEALKNRLDGLVQQGKITQEQADQYEQWWNSRPDVPAGIGGGPLGKLGGRGLGGGFRCFPGKLGPAASATQ